MSRVYVASSWRNDRQPQVVELLRSAGHEVYDFKNPPGRTGFSWSEVRSPSEPGIPAKGADWVPASEYLRMVEHPRSAAGFASDFDAMHWADTVVLVLPCGKSAHLELGWAAGAGKRTAVLLEDPCEPELMYLMADLLTSSVLLLLDWLGEVAG